MVDNAERRGGQPGTAVDGRRGRERGGGGRASSPRALVAGAGGVEVDAHVTAGRRGLDGGRRARAVVGAGAGARQGAEAGVVVRHGHQAAVAMDNGARAGGSRARGRGAFMSREARPWAASVDDGRRDGGGRAERERMRERSLRVRGRGRGRSVAGGAGEGETPRSMARPTRLRSSEGATEREGGGGRRRLRGSAGFWVGGTDASEAAHCARTVPARRWPPGGDEALPARLVEPRPRLELPARVCRGPPKHSYSAHAPPAAQAPS